MIASSSAWAIHWYEAAAPLVLVLLSILAGEVFSRRARTNRAKLRRRRRSEREIVRRNRAW